MKYVKIIYLKVKNAKVFPIYFEYKLYLVKFEIFRLTISSVIWLILRRLARFIKRIVMQSKVLSFPFIISLFFVTIFLRLGFSLEEFKSYPEAFWEFRDFFLTAIFITITTNIFQEERLFKKNLSLQSSLYSNYIYNSTDFILSLSKIIAFEPEKKQPILIYEYQLYDVFFTDLDSFIDNKKSRLTIVKEEVPIEINQTLYLTLILKKFKTYIEYTSNSITENTLIGFGNYDKEIFNELSFFLDVKIAIIQNAPNCYRNEEDLNRYLAVQISEVIKESSPLLFRTAATLRRPWRWDLRRTFQIKQILSDNGYYFYEIGEDNNFNFYNQHLQETNDDFIFVDKLRFYKIIICLLTLITLYLIVFKIKSILGLMILLLLAIIIIFKLKKNTHIKFTYTILILIFSTLIKYINLKFF